MVDLRSEFIDLITEGESIGHWMCIRRFSDEHSEYWRPESQEAIGGPAYKFTDEVMKVYSTLASKRWMSIGANQEQQGTIDTKYKLFYLPYDVSIKVNDEVYELDCGGDLPKPTPVYKTSDENPSQRKYALKDKFKIKLVEKFRALNGRVEYVIAFGEISYYR